MYSPDDFTPVQPPPPPRLSGPGPAVLGISLLVLSLVVFLVVLGGLGLIPNPVAESNPVVPPPVPTPSSAPPSPGRFAQEGECVRNEGTDAAPQLVVVECTPGGLVVLKRVPDSTDVGVCASVEGYRYHYFFDSELGGLDFVLCMGVRP